jgi:hypothetical protein
MKEEERNDFLKENKVIKEPFEIRSSDNDEMEEEKIKKKEEEKKKEGKIVEEVN